MKLTLVEAQKIMRENGNNLNLRWRQIECLPDGLVVKGNLNLYGNPIKVLPKGLVVYGNLILSKTLVEYLPNDLIVGGNVDLDNTPIKTLPPDLIVCGYLDLSYTPIKVLPNNLVIGKSLYLQNTSLTTLPKGLVIGECLDLRKTWITALPSDIIVNGRVYEDGLKVGNPTCHYMQNGYYIPNRYVYANGVLTQIERCNIEQGFVVYYGKLSNRNVVSNGEQYVVCANIQSGIDELISKDMTKNSTKCKNLTFYSMISETKRRDIKKVTQA